MERVLHDKSRAGAYAHLDLHDGWIHCEEPTTACLWMMKPVSTIEGILTNVSIRRNLREEQHNNDIT